MRRSRLVPRDPRSSRIGRSRCSDQTGSAKGNERSAAQARAGRRRVDRVRALPRRRNRRRSEVGAITSCAGTRAASWDRWARACAHCCTVSSGLPATILIPFVPAVHALRLFGRMRSDTDRSWMLFLAGATAVLPIALGLAVERGSPRSGIDGVGLVRRFLFVGVFGPVGAWFVVSIWSAL